MGTATQDNWNKHFGNKRTPRFNGGRYVVLIIGLIILIAVAFVNKDYLANILINGFGSSLDGVQMNHMVSTVHDIIEENKDYVDELLSVYNTDNLSSDADKVFGEWNAFINNSMDKLARIKYHKSYSDYIGAAKNTLYITEQFVKDLKAYKLDYLGISSGIDKINDQSKRVIDELTKAFDKNRIVYNRLDDNMITYQYKVK